MSRFYWWCIRNRLEFYAIGGRHYRRLAVPYTRKWKASHHQWRHIATTQERREIVALRNDEEIRHYKVRMTRRTDLPNLWDDDYPDARLNRNWKQFRRTRWK